MAKNEINYSDLTVEELQETISSQSEKLRQLKFNHSISVLENPLQIRDVRRSIAKLKTELQKRQTKKD